MGAFEEFETGLRDALANLYNPIYQPPASLSAVIGRDPSLGPGSIQAAIIATIEDLQPAPSVPAGAPVRRFYELLLHRYVKTLTQEAAAERLSISPRYLRNLQWKAVRVLARRLWDAAQASPPFTGDRARSDDMGLAQVEPGKVSQLWLSQMRKELASLRRSAPNLVADLAATTRGAVRLARELPVTDQIEVAMGVVEPGLRAMIHPSALRQIMLSAIHELAQGMSSGSITIYASHKEDRATISIGGSPVAAGKAIDISLMHEVLAMHRGSVEVSVEGDHRSIELRLPTMSPADKVLVLVIDDNEDLVSFYKSYTVGTAYEILHVREGSRAFQAIEERRPDVIVLDVMLPDPDIDGWELLMHLHEHPTTRPIPVIVCSVIRDQELALALGAVLYLPKPVRRQQLLGALNEVVSQASLEASPTVANNPGAC